MSLLPERHPEGSPNPEKVPVQTPQNKVKGLARYMAGPFLGLSLTVACLQGEQKPPLEQLQVPQQTGELQTSEQMRKLVLSGWSIPPDMEQARLSPKDRAWETRGIEDLYLILKESINPAFQTPELMDRIGQDLTQLSDVNLLRLQRDLRYLGYSGSGRLSDLRTTETPWGTVGLGPHKPTIGLHVYNESLSNGFPGRISSYSIRVDLSNPWVPELRRFINVDENGTNWGVKPDGLGPAVATLFQLPRDFQWQPQPPGRGAARGIQGIGTLPTGEKVNVTVDLAGYDAKLTVTKP